MEARTNNPFSLLRPEVLAGLSTLELVARQAVEGFFQGMHRSPRFGFSQEFAEYKAYSEGDDPRFVDWNVFARTDRTYIRRYLGETNTPSEHKVRDVSEVLDELGPPRAARHPIDARVAYHDACHLAHAQGVRAQPRALLAAIPGVTVVPVADADVCCGSAGIFNLTQPEMAQQLGDRKVGHLAASTPTHVVTSNPGCLLQIQSTARRQGHTFKVLHLVELLDASIAGACGLGLALLLLRITQMPFDSTLSDFFDEYAYVIAHGRNIVNVIIVDFRGLDTLGEIAVVMVAGLAILALIRVRAPKPAVTHAKQPAPKKELVEG